MRAARSSEGRVAGSSGFCKARAARGCGAALFQEDALHNCSIVCVEVLLYAVHLPMSLASAHVSFLPEDAHAQR